MKHREERFRDYHDATLPMIVWIERRFEEDTVLVRAMPGRLDRALVAPPDVPDCIA